MKGTKSYSRGRVESKWDKTYGVNWKTIGKEWATEQALKKHLLTCIQKGVDMTDWEIMEFTQQPSKTLNDWCDAKMTFAMLKHV